MAQSIEVKLIGDDSSLRRAMRNASSSTSQFGSSVSKSGGPLSKFTSLLGGVSGPALAVTAGISATAVAVKGFIDKATEAEVVNRKMQAQLKAMGISYEKHKGQIDKVITAHSRLTGIDDEELTEAFTSLVRVTDDVNKSLKLNELAADIAAARNMDLGTAAELVGKVYAGKTGVLARYGIVLDKNATSTEALTELQRRFAGQAEASATGQQKLAVAFENIQESLGKRLLPAFEKLSTWLAEKLPEFEAKVGPAFKAIGDAIEAVKPIIDAVMPTLMALADFLLTQMIAPIEVIAKLLKGDFSGAWEAAQKPIKAFADLIKTAFGPAVEKIVSALNEAVKAVTNKATAAYNASKNFGAKLLKGVKDGITGFAGAVSSRVTEALGAVRDAAQRAYNAAENFGSRILRGLKDGITGFAGAVASRVSEAIQAVVNAFERAYNTGKTLGSKVMGGMKTGLVEVWKVVRDWIADRPGAVVRAIGDVSKLLWSTGWSIMNSLWDGMKYVWNKISEWLGSLGGLMPKVKGPPAKDRVLLAPTGRMIMGGLASGMQEGWRKDVVPFLQSAGPALTVGMPTPGMSVSAASPGVAPTTTTLGAASANININADVRSPADVEILAQAVARKLAFAGR